MSVAFFIEKEKVNEEEKRFCGFITTVIGVLIFYFLNISLYINTMTSLTCFVYAQSYKNINEQLKFLNKNNLTYDHGIKGLEQVPSEFLHWFAGFSDGESNFQISYDQKTNRISFAFSIFLHIDDLDVLKTIATTLGVGTVNTVKKGDSLSKCSFRVRKLSDIENIIIPIFNYTGLYTNKNLDFQDFSKAFFISNNNNNLPIKSIRNTLTPENLALILKLKSGMNKGRNLKNNLYEPSSLDSIETISDLFKNENLPKLNPY
jgi:hypothetical protein